MQENRFKSGPLERFDLIMVLVIVGLIAVTGVVVARGDQVGISVKSYGPREVGASSRPIIQITFDEPVNLDTAQAAFAINPPVKGSFSAVNQQITFQPTETLQRGQVYTITLRAGITGSSGRQLKQALTWQFNVRQPRIVYLAPVDKIVQNLYLVDPGAPESPQQLTTSTMGVLGFDVSPDGNRIIYSQVEGQAGAASLYVWEAANGASTLLYDCKDASCTNPVWRPDGNAVAYERTDLNTGTGMAPGVPRVWVLDLVQNVAQPLFRDSQSLGYSPRWSPDGKKLAVFDVNSSGIVIHDFVSAKDNLIRTVQGELGTFSPDGKWIFFPKVVEIEKGSNAIHIVLADVSSDPYVQHDLIPDNDPGNDVQAAWSADSQSMIVARRPPYSQKAASGPQLYQIALATGAATPLVEDKNYSNGDVVVSPLADSIVFQRFALNQPGSRPELWALNLATHELKQLVTNATSPHWMP